MNQDERKEMSATIRERFAHRLAEAMQGRGEELKKAIGADVDLDNLLYVLRSRAGPAICDKESLDGLRVLDIGCGSPNSQWFEGWGPRLAVCFGLLGAKVVGVDCSSNENPFYEHVNMDLFYEKLNDRLAGNEFDLAIMANFCGVEPELLSHSASARQRAAQKPGNLDKRIASDIYRLLRPGGQFIVVPGCGEADSYPYDLHKMGFELDKMAIMYLLVRKPE